MRRSLDLNNLILIGIFLVFLVSPVAAEWKIDVLDQPYSFENVSNASETVQVVELVDGDNTSINESQLVGDSYFQYKYNGSTRDMKWLQDGYWYADFQLNNAGGSVEFEAEGETESSLIEDSTSETNSTRTFNLGNMSVDLMTDLSGNINPENSFDIKVNVTNTTDGFEDQADVDLYFTNRTWTSEIYNINNMGDMDGDGTDDYYKNFGLNFNLAYNSTYVLHINATNITDVGYEEPFGTHSATLNTLPEIEGHVENLNAESGCNNESFFTACERDTNIDTGLNITSSNAEKVNLTLQLKDRESGEWEDNTTRELDEENDLYTGSVTVPDINTSEYEREFRLRYNASNGERTEIIDKVIDYNDFKIVDKSDSITGKGSYRVKLEIRKFFTPNLLTTSRIDDSSITITQPSGELLSSFEVSDMERMTDPGYFKRKITIPVNSETGIYDMEVEVTNLYNQTKLETFNFNVTEVQKTFSLNDGEDDFERVVDKTGNHTFNITVENEIDSETNISTNVSEELDSFTEVNNGENVILDPLESRNISVNYSISEVEEHDGEIKFMDKEANYNTTLDVELVHSSCTYRTGSVCVLGSDLNVTSDEREDITKDFTVFNFGEKDESYSFSFSLSGDVASYADLSSTGEILNTENDSENVNLSYSVSAPGTHTGTLEVSNGEDTVNIPVSLESNVEATSKSISMEENIDLGEVQEGDSVSGEIDIENTGDLEVTGLEASSNSYSVSIESASIAPGSTEAVSIEFSDVTSESGQVTVTAQTNSESISQTADVSASVVVDYSRRADELEQRLIDLDSQVSSDSEYQTELNNAQSDIQDIRTAYRQENYEEAETLYSQVQSTLDTVQAETRRGGTSPGTGQTDPGDQTNEGGGIPILPIAAGIFVFLLVGFVAYSSIELEPGDPLYNVLG